MANVVQQYRTSVAGRVPAAANMDVGEIAINMADKIMYTKDDSGNIIRVGVGTYTKTEMDTKFLPQGILPITRVGDLTATALPITLSAQTLSVNSAIPVILSGRQFSMAIGTFNFASVLAGMTGTAYVYLTLSNSLPVLDCSMTAQPESTTRVYLGTLQVAAGTTSGLSLQKVSRLDTYRPSLNPAGSSFPVSSGTPDTSGSINW